MFGNCKNILAISTLLFLTSHAAPVLDKRSCGGFIQIPDCIPGYSTLVRTNATFDTLNVNTPAGNYSGLIFQGFNVASPANNSIASLAPSSGSNYVYAQNMRTATTSAQLPQVKPDSTKYQMMKLKTFNFGCSLPAASSSAEIPWPCVLTVTAMTPNPAGADNVVGSATFTYTPGWMSMHANLTGVNFATSNASLAVHPYFTFNVTDVPGNGNQNPSFWMDDLNYVVYGNTY